MKVIKVTTVEDLNSLAPAWRALAAADPSATAFQRIEWLLSWWEVFGQGRELFVLAAFDGNRLTGAAPWCRRTVSVLGWKVRRLQFMADGISDYCQLLSLPGQEARVWDALQTYLLEHKRDWDVLSWKEMPNDQAERLAQRMRPELRRWRRRTSKTFLVPLQGTWETFRESLNKRLVKKFDRQARLLGHYRMATYSGEALTPEVTATLTELSRTIPADRRAGSIFLHPQYHRFHCDLLWNSPMKRDVEIMILYLGDTPAAYRYSFLYQGTMGLYNCSFSEQFSKISLGLFMDLINIRHAYAGGYKVFDFLRGDYWFKTQYNSQVQQNWELTCASGLGAEIVDRLVGALEQGIRAMYRKTLLPVRRGTQAAAANLAEVWKFARARGWRYGMVLAGRAVGRALYQHGEVYGMRGRIRDVAAAEAGEANPGIEVRELLISDYSLLEQAVGSRNMPEMVCRFWSGDLCWGIFLGERMAGYVWVTSKPQCDRHYGIPVLIKHDETYLYDGMILESFRGRNCMAILLRSVARDPRLRKSLFLTGMVDIRNAPMIKTMKKLNFVIEEKIARTRWLCFGMQKRLRLAALQVPARPDRQPQLTK